MVPPLWVDSDLRGWLRFTRLQSFRAAAARTADRITTDQKAAISRAVVRANSVKTRKLTRQSDQILVPDDRERGAEREESGIRICFPGKRYLHSHLHSVSSGLPPETGHSRPREHVLRARLTNRREPFARSASRHLLRVRRSKIAARVPGRRRLPFRDFLGIPVAGFTTV